MKPSIYNSYIKLSNDKALIFNSKKNEYITINPKYISDIKNEKLDNLPSDLQKNIIKGGFFIKKNNSDETKWLIEHRKKQYNDSSKYTLTINPTLNCNLSCWYCYETKNTSKMSEQLIDSVKLFIKNTITSHPDLKQFELSFFGGEPLLHFNKIVHPCIIVAKEYCKLKNIELNIGFTTNGYLITDDIINKIKGEDNVAFQITLDGDKETHNQIRYLKQKKGTYDTILNNVKKLLSVEGFHVTLRFNCTKDNLLSLRNVLPDLEDLNNQQKDRMDIAFERVWQDYDNGDIKELMNNVQKQFEEKGFYIDDIDYLASPMWCEGNKINSAIINYNGEIFKCTARDFKSEKREGKLDLNGNIIWDEEKVNARYDALFSGNQCFQCRIAHICTERCSQKTLESGINGCPYNEKDKDELILNRFYAQIFERVSV